MYKTRKGQVGRRRIVIKIETGHVSRRVVEAIIKLFVAQRGFRDAASRREAPKSGALKNWLNFIGVDIIISILLLDMIDHYLEATLLV